jgi:hypothetical protein
LPQLYRVKNPDPKDLALDCPLRGLPYSFLLAAVCWSDGVVEWWSNGVMKGIIQVEIRAFVFSNTPILQYSSTSKQLSASAYQLV